MDTDNPKNNPQYDSNPTPSVIPIKKNDLPNKTSESNSTSNTNDSEVEKESPQIKQNNKMEAKDIISIGLNAMYVVTTIVIAVISYRGIKASNESNGKTIKIAEDNYNLAKESYESSSKENKERFERESIQAQLQISALNETVDELKGQFKSENMPYLTISTLDSVGFENIDEKTKSLKIVYRILNLGKHPVKTIGSIIFIAIAPQNDPRVKNDGIFSNEIYDGIIKKDLFIFFAIKVKYTNLISKEENLFYCIFKITTLTHPFQSDVMFMENKIIVP